MGGVVDEVFRCHVEWRLLSWGRCLELCCEEGLLFLLVYCKTRNNKMERSLYA